jgi:hypothetical protein
MQSLPLSPAYHHLPTLHQMVPIFLYFGALLVSLEIRKQQEDILQLA